MIGLKVHALAQLLGKLVDIKLVTGVVLLVKLQPLCVLLLCGLA